MWRRMTRGEASALSKEWDSADSDSFIYIQDGWTGECLKALPSKYRTMAEDIRKMSSDCYSGRTKGREVYPDDLKFALELYGTLNDKYGMTPGIASDDDVWRYIQMNVVPDVVYDRWADKGRPGERINEDRFWKNSRRMWLKTLWWYIHLSLQNDSLNDTYEILKNNTADDISQLVERAGSGYRVELYRAVMRRYHAYTGGDPMILRKVLKLNVVRCTTVEPLLFSSGVDGYVESLFRYFEE